MAKEEKVFESLSNAQEVFESKRGKEFRAQLSGFFAKDAEVVATNGTFLVKSFTNLSGSTDLINEKLGTDFVDDAEYKNIPANITHFVNTQEEADALAARYARGARIVTGVTVGTHEYNDNLYLDLRIDTPYVEAPRDNGKPEGAPKRKGQESADDLPF